MKVDRLISIIMILLEQKRVSAQALSEMFEVSPRTIYRDIDAINRAGIPVRSLSGVGGGFEIMPNYKLDKRVFSSAELAALLMGLNSLSSMVRSEDLLHALAKVKSLIPAESAESVTFKAKQFSVDLSPWLHEQSNQPYLELIQTALQENRLLSFDYRDRHGQKTTRIIEPYQLVLKSGQFYLQGYCYHRQDYRLFRLSRMSKLQLKKETFTPRAYPQPQLDYPDSSSPQKILVTLRIHHASLNRVLDVFPEAQVSSEGGEYDIVSFSFFANDYYYDLLLSFGAQCECLAPPAVRSEIKRRVQALAALYAD